jgi:hypothetical protein
MIPTVMTVTGSARWAEPFDPAVRGRRDCRERECPEGHGRGGDCHPELVEGWAWQSRAWFAAIVAGAVYGIAGPSFDRLRMTHTQAGG